MILRLKYCIITIIELYDPPQGTSHGLGIKKNDLLFCICLYDSVF